MCGVCVISRERNSSSSSRESLGEFVGMRRECHNGQYIYKYEHELELDHNGLSIVNYQFWFYPFVQNLQFTERYLLLLLVGSNNDF